MDKAIKNIGALCLGLAVLGVFYVFLFGTGPHCKEWKRAAYKSKTHICLGWEAPIWKGILRNGD